mmetsp:Transcript_32798/g.76534  ORF Transcript_32798/g.76534 Transcript_32798/m.76534 type:complete len:296 (-) Transcript_32798:6-893(-)
MLRRYAVTDSCTSLDCAGSLRTRCASPGCAPRVEESTAILSSIAPRSPASLTSDASSMRSPISALTRPCPERAGAGAAPPPTGSRSIASSCFTRCSYTCTWSVYFCSAPVAAFLASHAASSAFFPARFSRSTARSPECASRALCADTALRATSSSAASRSTVRDLMPAAFFPTRSFFSSLSLLNLASSTSSCTPGPSTSRLPMPFCPLCMSCMSLNRYGVPPDGVVVLAILVSLPCPFPLYACRAANTLVGASSSSAAGRRPATARSDSPMLAIATAATAQTATSGALQTIFDAS